ncbi:hypothetical protein ACIP79_00580 [Streptomyces sp. NPDC088747]|uniref:hypothetical protein n=1 Tax=Streptomyces sp. NPDC088747 TaxID=3365886 RepID=UPI00381B2123
MTIRGLLRHVGVKVGPVIKVAGRVVDHEYLSTGCLHGEHDYCKATAGKAGAKQPAQCKFCGAPCICECHQADTAPPVTCPECGEPYREVPGGHSCTHAMDCQYTFRNRTPGVEPCLRCEHDERTRGVIQLSTMELYPPDHAPTCVVSQGHYGDSGNGISGWHTGRVEDCTGPGCGPQECGAMATTAGASFGPCIKRERHKDWHEDANGTRWTTRCQACGRTEREQCNCPPDDAVSVPRDALRGLVEVARQVSERWPHGGFMAPDKPHPNHGTASDALRALDDAGLLDQFREDGTDG